jgi:hypothetical protein
VKPAKKVAGTLGSTLLGGIGLKSAAKGLGLIGSFAAAPDLPEVAAMPTVNDAAAQAARRRRMQMNQARSGRQSTMLSTTDTLG